jgi:membrane carboxypeptidase/penicillin-binding protein
MKELYLKLEDYHNYFQPTSKVVWKERGDDGKVRKIYDAPRTPYERVLESPFVSEEKKRELMRRYQELDLYQLRVEITKLIDKLCRLARRKGC